MRLTEDCRGGFKLKAINHKITSCRFSRRECQVSRSSPLEASGSYQNYFWELLKLSFCNSPCCSTASSSCLVTNRKTLILNKITGLDGQNLLSWYGFHEEHGLKNSSNVLSLFQDCYKTKYYSASCLKNEAVNQLKVTFICWKATRVSPHYTNRLAVCAHFERHLTPSLWTMVLQTSENVYHLNL